MTAPSQKRKRMPRSGCLVILALAGALALLALVLVVVLQARARPMPGPRVSIRQPRPGARLSVEDGSLVVLQAPSQEPIIRYELWVDGERQAILQPAEGEESLPDSAQLRWLPRTEGVHVLAARAYDRRGLQGISTPAAVEAVAGHDAAVIGVRLEVLPGDSVESLAARSGLSPDLLAGVLPSADIDLSGGEVIVPVPREQLPSFYFGEGGAEPAAPDQAEAEPPVLSPPAGFPDPAAALTAEHADGCRVRLSWRVDEPGVQVRLYRFGGQAEDFTSVADVNPAASEYLDTVRWGGDYLYLVATVGRSGETPGPMGRVSVPADACPEEEPLPETGLAWLQFEAARLVTDEAFDRLYCYLSLDGERYQRIPAEEDSSLRSVGDGWDLSLYLSGIRRRVFQHDVGQPVSVAMECWGWRGDTLTPLGEIVDLRPLDDWSADLRGLGPGFHMFYSLWTYHNDLPLSVPVDYHEEPLPPPYDVRFSTSPVDCLSHVNFGGGSEAYPAEGLLSQWACLELDAMLVWRWPPAGDYDLEDIDGFRVEVHEDYERLDVHDIWGSLVADWATAGETGSANQASPIPSRPPCTHVFGYRVQAYKDTPAGRLASEWSEVYTDERTDCPEEAVVEIELLDIEVHELDDGCVAWCGGETLQAYGSGEWIIHTPRYDSSGSVVGTVAYPSARTDFWTGECGAGFGEGCLFTPRTVRNGTIDLATEDLRRCQGSACTDFGPGNNTVRLILGAGDTVEFQFVLWDVDDVEDDVWCGTMEDIGFGDRLRQGAGTQEYETAPWVIGEIFGDQSLRGWAEASFEDWFPNTAFPALSDQDSECNVHVRVRGLGLYRPVY